MITREPKRNLHDLALAAAMQRLIDGKELSVRKIAADIDCAAPTLYYHFKNLEDLYDSLGDHVAAHSEDVIALYIRECIKKDIQANLVALDAHRAQYVCMLAVAPFIKNDKVIEND